MYLQIRCQTYLLSLRSSLMYHMIKHATPCVKMAFWYLLGKIGLFINKFVYTSVLIKVLNISDMCFKYGHILSVHIIPTPVSRKRTQQQQISQEFLYIRRAFGTHSDLLEHYYAVNSLASRNNLKYNLCTHITNYIHGHLLKHCSQRNVTAHLNIASGNDLVRSRNKALPESMFT